MKSPRERALAHLKTLVAAGVVVGGCHASGYGVVDPMPIPSCFENPPAVVTGKILETREDGVRLVEVRVKFQQQGAKLDELNVYDDAGGKKMEIVEQTIEADNFRFTMLVPKVIHDVTLSANVRCASGGGYAVGLRIDDSGVTPR